MIEEIKKKIRLNNNFYRQYMRHQMQIISLLEVEDLCIKSSNLITKSNEN